MIKRMIQITIWMIRKMRKIMFHSPHARNAQGNTVDLQVLHDVHGHKREGLVSYDENDLYNRDYFQPPWS